MYRYLLNFIFACLCSVAAQADVLPVIIYKYIACVSRTYWFWYARYTPVSSVQRDCIREYILRVICSYSENTLLLVLYIEKKYTIISFSMNF